MLKKILWIIWYSYIVFISIFGINTIVKLMNYFTKHQDIIPLIIAFFMTICITYLWNLVAIRLIKSYKLINEKSGD